MTATSPDAGGLPIPVSEKHFANRLGRLYLQALKATIGSGNYEKLLVTTGSRLEVQALPPGNWEREFDIANIATLDQGLTALYGPNGARRMASKTGTYFFDHGLRKLSALAPLKDLSQRAMPTTAKMSLALGALTRLLVSSSDQQVWLEEQGAFFQYEQTPCPICWGRQADRAICFFVSGLLQETVRWATGGQEHRITQVQCHATGNKYCTFHVDKQPLR